MEKNRSDTRAAVFPRTQQKTRCFISGRGGVDRRRRSGEECWEIGRTLHWSTAGYINQSIKVAVGDWIREQAVCV